MSSVDIEEGKPRFCWGGHNARTVAGAVLSPIHSQCPADWASGTFCAATALAFYVDNHVKGFVQWRRIRHPPRDTSQGHRCRSTGDRVRYRHGCRPHRERARLVHADRGEDAVRWRFDGAVRWSVLDACQPILAKAGAGDTVERAKTYVRSVVGDTAPPANVGSIRRQRCGHRRHALPHDAHEVLLGQGILRLPPELPGGSAAGRTCECLPFDASVLGAERGRLRPGLMEAGLPMPVTGADYKWMNLMVKKPSKAFPRIIRRLAQGVYGKYVLKREYIAGGQALAAGLFAGVVQAGIPVWTETSLVRLITEDGRVTGAVVVQDGREVTVTARRGVVLAAGGFDHNMEWRHKYQSESLGEHESLGAEGNTGEAIEAAQELGAGIGSMDQSWWFPPAVASIKAARRW